MGTDSNLRNVYFTGCLRSSFRISSRGNTTCRPSVQCLASLEKLVIGRTEILCTRGYSRRQVKRVKLLATFLNEDRSAFSYLRTTWYAVSSQRQYIRGVRLSLRVWILPVLHLMCS